MGSILLMGAGLQTTVTGPTYDPDAQLFFNAQTAAGVTLTLTQKSAVNQWVVDSKAAGIWTKFKAIYPVVGGTATAHKFNLKNPLDTDAAFRLAFIGGGTHSSNGYLPNGVNAYANTFFAPSVNSTGINNFHSSYYSRTNVNLTQVDSGCGSSDLQGTLLEIRTANITYIRINAATTSSYADTDSLGFYSQSRLLGNTQKGYKNNILKVTGTVNSNTAPSQNFYIGAYNNSNTPFYYSSKECAFASIGDGLTDLESQLFYQITEKYQVALSRNINTTQSFYYNSAYNNETNAFLFSTQITDNTIQTATNTLVANLKTAGVFTKMKAIYPMVGGTATTHKFNLANAQDSAAAFALSFIGGWTHSANGALPNGTNAYANTFLNGTLNLTANNSHISFYSRTNADNIAMDFGNSFNAFGSITKTGNTMISDFLGNGSPNVASPDRISVANTSSNANFIFSSTSSNIKIYKNSSILGQKGSATASAYPNSNILFSYGFTSSAARYSNRQLAFASIGDGLTDAEALAFYNAVQTFNTTLARQV